jgi:hypothetical protein
VEVWTEVNIVPRRPLDEAVLAELVDVLVHEELGSEIETWFFFWEPELRLRIRWRDPARVDEHRRTLATLLDRWKSDRHVAKWYEAAHGQRGETYVGEAEHYGEEVWARVQKDWMNGSELALALIKLERADRLTKPRSYHWQRHVHLFTNQLFASWDSEIELCLRQALGYLRMLPTPPTPQTKTLIGEIHDFLRDG